jgi:acetyl-CoA acetyltransferase
VPATGRKAAIAGVYNTKQGRSLEGETTRRLVVEAALGALDDAGLTLDDVDGITSEQTASLGYDLRLGPAWQGSAFGVGMITEAVAAIEHGLAEVVVLVAAQAQEYRDHAATAPWTRPENEFVAPWGMFTTAEFALIARRHMEVYGTTR